jgi:hypothetical protein
MPRDSYEGLPGFKPVAQRPRCRNCNKPLKPHVTRRAVEGAAGVRRTKADQVVWYGYDSHELFCSLTCGYLFGVRAAGGDA